MPPTNGARHHPVKQGGIENRAREQKPHAIRNSMRAGMGSFSAKTNYVRDTALEGDRGLDSQTFPCRSGFSGCFATPSLGFARLSINNLVTRLFKETNNLDFQDCVWPSGISGCLVFPSLGFARLSINNLEFPGCLKKL
jgi:hypothetical protein